MVEEEENRQQIKEAQQLFVNGPEGYINHITNSSCLSLSCFVLVGLHIYLSVYGKCGF